MKRIVFISFFCCLLSVPAYSAEDETPQTQPQTPEIEVKPADLIQYTHYGKVPEIQELDESEDDLYSGAEVKPMDIQISEEEKMQNVSADFDYVDKEYELPELLCNNPNLTKQVAQFIQNNTEDKEGSVKGRRSRLLMIKNLHDFTEISENDLSKHDNFKTRAALVHLRINENREITRVCESKENTFGKFHNVYLILYPYMKYYKVVVTNMISVPEKLEDASFIYSW